MPRDRDSEEFNTHHWDELAPVHLASYGLEPLISGGHLLDAVQVDEMGDVRGTRLLHLQCHIGSDTLSWARLGADVTGVDISKASIEAARALAMRCGLEARFINSSIYDLPGLLDEDFDIVYTSEGVLCWLSDLQAWARIIHLFLRPGGRFYILESHPFTNVLDYESDGLSVSHSYFGDGRPEESPGGYPDYSDGSYTVRSGTREWSWTLGDIVNSLIGAGLDIEFLHEFPHLAWRAIPAMEKHDGFYRLPEGYPDLPFSFSLSARKPCQQQSGEPTRDDG